LIYAGGSYDEIIENFNKTTLTQFVTAHDHSVSKPRSEPKEELKKKIFLVR